MCLLKMKVERDEEISEPPRRIVIRSGSRPNSTIVVSRPVSRSHSHSHSRHSPRHSPRTSARVISTTVLEPGPRPAQYVVAGGGSPGAARSIPRIVHAYAPSPPRSRERLEIDGSPRGSRTSMRSVHDSVVYVERRGSTRERPRSGRYLSTGEVVDSYGQMDTPRATLYLDENPSRTRSRSITYATTGPRLSRERVVVEEAGRRRESYRPLGSI